MFFERVYYLYYLNKGNIYIPTNTNILNKYSLRSNFKNQIVFALSVDHCFMCVYTYKILYCINTIILKRILYFTT